MKRKIFIPLIVLYCCLNILFISCTSQNHECEFGEWVTDVPATCTVDGVMVRTCNKCDNKETEVIKAKGHVEILISGVEATCQAVGLTSGKKCEVCGGILEIQKEIPLKEHTFDDEHDLKCNVCGYIRSCEHKNIDFIKGKDATCLEDGYTDFEKCLDCGLVLLEQQIIPSYGHSFSSWTTDIDATCDSNGTRYKECKNCKKIITHDIIKPYGHNFDKWNDEILSTCTENGVHGYKHCLTCDRNYDIDDNEILSLIILSSGHTYGDWNEEVPVTCTNDGCVGYHTCLLCDKNLDKNDNEISNVVILSSGHKYSTWNEEVPSTCIKEGTLGHFNCLVCSSKFDSSYNELSSIFIKKK